MSSTIFNYYLSKKKCSYSSLKMFIIRQLTGRVDVDLRKIKLRTRKKLEVLNATCPSNSRR